MAVIESVSVSVVTVVVFVYQVPADIHPQEKQFFASGAFGSWWKGRRGLLVLGGKDEAFWFLVERMKWGGSEKTVCFDRRWAPLVFNCLFDVYFLSLFFF